MANGKRLRLINLINLSKSTCNSLLYINKTITDGHLLLIIGDNVNTLAKQAAIH